ncbi:hypothetical protein FRB91_002313 [Serendipita sp. 411]|nr:hypothetical protein FRC19_003363 [Serendipita sp. 401]KAG8844800.1 hypothetical protein FRB91_002313 [Serendipita sp. 411]KAG9048916.1 hypothetical protein FS842_000279 [Serendipita sp. 407]
MKRGHILDHPYGDHYSAEDNTNLAGYHNNQVNAKLADKKLLDSEADGHETKRDNALKLQAHATKVGLHEEAAEEGKNAEEYDAKAKHAREMSSQKEEEANMHSNFRTAHLLAADAKRTGSNDKVAEGYAHYHEGLEAYRGVPPRGKSAAEHEALVDDTQKRSEKDLERAPNRMVRMSNQYKEAHQAALQASQQNPTPFPAPEGAIKRAPTLKAKRKPGRTLKNPFGDFWGSKS